MYMTFFFFFRFVCRNTKSCSTAHGHRSVVNVSGYLRLPFISALPTPSLLVHLAGVLKAFCSRKEPCWSRGSPDGSCWTRPSIRWATDRPTCRLTNWPQQAAKPKQAAIEKQLSLTAVLSFPPPLTPLAEILREPPGQGVQGGDRAGRGGVRHTGDAGHGGA